MNAIESNTSREERTLTVGLDLGDKYIHYCILNAEGVVADEGRIKSSPQALAKKFAAFKSNVFALAS